MERHNFLVKKTSLVYDMDLILMIVRVAPICHGCVIYLVRNGSADSIHILNENHPIHLIHLGLKKDPFPSILYSHIPVRNSRAAPGSLFHPVIQLLNEINDIKKKWNKISFPLQQQRHTHDKSKKINKIVMLDITLFPFISFVLQCHLAL